MKSARVLAVVVVAAVAVALLVGKGAKRGATPATPAIGASESPTRIDAAPASLIDPLVLAERQPSPDPGLSDGVRVRGHVVDPRGLPVASFSLRAFRSIDDVRHRDIVASQRFDSGVDGTFELDELPAGTLTIEARAEGFAPGLSASVDAPAGSTENDVLVRLTVGRTLRGRVLDARTRTPVAGARIEATAEHARTLWQDAEPVNARTDASGRFVLEHLAAETYLVRIDADGYASACVPDVIVTENDETILPAVSLVVGALVSGVVIGPEGVPLTNAPVQLTPDEIDEVRIPRSVRCDARGGYRFEHVVPGHYEICATRNGGSQDPFVELAEIDHSKRALRAEDRATCVLDLRLPADARK